MHDKTRQLHISLLLGSLLLLLLHCAKNPVTGKKELALISEAQEIAIGKETHPEILAQFGRVPDEDLQNYFSELGLRMAAVSHRPNLPWTFTVLDDPLVNAFALPGGHIYFTRGILSYMNNEAEMAGVLGHEIGHVTARHSVSQISKAQLVGLGVGLGSIFSPTFGRFSDLAQMGLGLLFLKYGRDDERESDSLGIQYMYKMGYDPRQLSSFFEVFQTMSEQSGSAVPSWMSSHPAPEDRIGSTARQAEELMSREEKLGDLLIRSREFLEHIDNVVFGENPREGFTRDGTFYHPDLRFRIDYPADWKVQNSKAVVLFVAPSQRAGVQLSLAPNEIRSPEDRARQLAQEPGIEMLEGVSRRVNGLPAYLALYRASDQRGSVLQILASFVDYGNLVYQLLGIGSTQEFAQYRGQLDRVIGSFRELRDPGILKVQPDRLGLYQIRRGGTIADVARLYPNPRVSPAELALLNRVGDSERLPAGRVVKVVRAGR
jgi:predicted Zn-dependent protease